jgi:hypothetical protein
MPTGYALKSMLYGSTDLTGTSLKISAADTAELRLTLSTPDLPAVKVSGRVLNVETSATRGPFTVVLNATGVRSLQTTVQTDGSFEFPAVFPGNYTARLDASQPNIGLVSANVIVANIDITNVELALPKQKEISGRVILEGRGPMPRVIIPMNSVRPGSGSVVLAPNPDREGNFKVVLPEGERRAAAPVNLPPGYTLTSLTYGSTDLLTSAMKISATDTSEIRVTISAPMVAPVKVSGTVTGMDSATFARGPVIVNLIVPNYVGQLQATVAADGSFEFPEVFPGTYSAVIAGPLLAPANAPIVAAALGTMLGPVAGGLGFGTAAGGPGVVASFPIGLATTFAPQLVTVVVADKDVRDVRIAFPVQKTISGRLTVDGGGPLFRVFLTAISASTDGTGRSVGGVLGLSPLSGGTLRFPIPPGDYNIRVNQLPDGYELTAMSFGKTDLSQSRLHVDSSETSDELLITLKKTKPTPWVSVSGRVVGLPTGASNVRVGLTGQFTLPQQVPVAADGTFSFTQVFSGSHTVQVLGLAGQPPSPPVPFTVGSKDVTDLEVVVSR